MSVSYEELTSLPPNLCGRSTSGELQTLHGLQLTWAQWTDVLTYNIRARSLKVAATHHS